VTDAEETIFPDWLTGPLGPGVVPLRGERLRRWGLSEVWRIESDGPGPRSVVVKRGTGEMAEEAQRYRELLVPLGLPAPRLLAAHGGGPGGEPGLLVLEDVGRETLEQRPTAEGYREAVRTLARMRATAARGLARDPSLGAVLRRSPADFADLALRARTGLDALRPDLAGALDAPARRLSERLAAVDGPPTVVHGDFHAKNLVHGDGGRITPVDWPGAYVHAHLGDLYCLLREARKHGLGERVGAATLPAVFAEAAGVDPAAVPGQLVTGGLCWTLIALRWVVEEGVRAVPEAGGWIDELVAEARALAEDGGGWDVSPCHRRSGRAD
jgi:streptomycin 6-kinase